MLVPGDWKVGDPTICNTRPGVEAFYGDRSSGGLNTVLESVKSWFSFGRKPKPVSPPINIRSDKEDHAQKPDIVGTPSPHQQTSEQGDGKMISAPSMNSASTGHSNRSAPSMNSTSTGHSNRSAPSMNSTSTGHSTHSVPSMNSASTGSEHSSLSDPSKNKLKSAT